MKPIVNTPVYHQSAAYAREHGELDQFRQSHQANIACKKDIEEAIFQNFDGFRLNKHAISGVWKVRPGACRSGVGSDRSGESLGWPLFFCQQGLGLHLRFS